MIIVKEAVVRLAPSVHGRISLSRPGALTGVSSVDKVLRAHRVKVVEPAIRSEQRADSEEFLGLIRVVVDGETDLESLVSDLEQSPDVDSVSVRYPARTMVSAS